MSHTLQNGRAGVLWLWPPCHISAPTRLMHGGHCTPVTSPTANPIQASPKKAFALRSLVQLLYSSTPACFSFVRRPDPSGPFSGPTYPAPCSSMPPGDAQPWACGRASAFGVAGRTLCCGYGWPTVSVVRTLPLPVLTPQPNNQTNKSRPMLPPPALFAAFSTGRTTGTRARTSRCVRDACLSVCLCMALL